MFTLLTFQIFNVEREPWVDMTISQHAKEANLDKKAIMYQVYEPSKQIGALIECLTYFVFQMIKTSETLEAACGPFRECLALWMGPLVKYGNFTISAGNRNEFVHYTR